MLAMTLTFCEGQQRGSAPDRTMAFGLMAASLPEIESSLLYISRKVRCVCILVAKLGYECYKKSADARRQ